MGTLVWKPAADTFADTQVLTVASSRTYTIEAGVPAEIIPEDIAAVTTALKAIQGNMGTPGVPAIVPQGTTGAATWGYKIAAVSQAGDTQLSPEGTTGTGNATLTSGNNNRITVGTLPAHATGWRVVRTTSGGTPAGTNVDISGVIATTTTTFSDTGIAGSAYSAAGSAPPVDLVVAGPADA